MSVLELPQYHIEAAQYLLEMPKIRLIGKSKRSHSQSETAVRNRNYTGKTHLRGLKTLDS